MNTIRRKTMSKSFEKIVAGLELCKLIPAGEFEDSALVWDIHGKFDKWHVEKRVNRSVRFGDYGIMSPPHADISAPTLAEIRIELRNLSVNVIDGAITVSCRIDPEKTLYETAGDDNEVTAAALRLWLMVKGIKVK